jgi:predicted ATP-binding protein involved in virulence
MNSIEKTNFEQIYSRFFNLINKAREKIVTSVNQEMIIAYWQIGKTITEESRKAAKELLMVLT